MLMKFRSKFLRSLIYSFPLGPEYGTMKAAWKGFLTEAECVAAFHSQISDNLCNVEVPQIEMWQNNNYQKVQWINSESFDERVKNFVSDERV